MHTCVVHPVRALDKLGLQATHNGDKLNIYLSDKWSHPACSHPSAAASEERPAGYSS